MALQSFKVLVVGGGPVGLIAAHALHRAGIDFLVLERRPGAVIDAGSNLVLSPQGLGLLSQLGLSGKIASSSSPLGRMERMDHSGRSIGDSHLFTQMEKSFGSAPRVISRHSLTQVLYETLPRDAQAKILCNKKLSAIASTTDGVRATCADGSLYEASTLIGADGAHSSVRSLMRELALAANSANVNEEQPFLTTYRALWIRFPSSVGLPVGFTSETHGRDAATQVFMGEGSGVVGLYEKLAQPTKERLRHVEAGRDEIAQRWAHLPISPNSTLTLGDLYAARLEAGLVSLEEGVVENWGWDGRIVLAGDAAHKFTPSTGAGCNNGMIDIAVLVDQLHRLLQETQTPSHAQLAASFQAYQQSRHAVVSSECATSGRATEIATWQSGLFKLIDRQIMSRHAIQRFLISSGAKRASKNVGYTFLSGSRPASFAHEVAPMLPAVLMNE